MKKINKHWKSLRFQTKLLILLIMTLFFCMGGVLGITQYTMKATMQENAIESGMAENDNRAMMLELNLAQIAKLSSNLYSNADVYSLLRTEFLDSQQEYRISLFLRSMMSMSASVNLYQIYLDIYSSGRSFIIGSNGNSSTTPSRYHVSIPDYIEAGDVYCEGPHLSTTYDSTIGGVGVDVYSFHWKLYDNAQSNVIGTISFDVALDEMLSYVFSNSDQVGFLMQDGNVIFSQGGSFTNQDANAIMQQMGGERWGEIHMSSFQGIAFYSPLELNNVSLQLVRMIPERQLYAEADRMLLRNLIIMLLAFLICSIGILIVVRETTRPIRQLDSCMKAIEEQGDLGYRVADHIDYSASDELGNLIRQTDNMLETVEDLFEREKMMSRAQRDAEAKMLQAQINPHFLYNSLQSIASQALARGQKDIYNYITLLGSRMHYSMDLEQSTAELKKEFEYVENYLILQNVRFGNTMQVVINLETEAEHRIVPKMILQPLAENAFKHGKLCRIQGNQFRLFGRMKGSMLEIIMENTGIPIPPEQIEELNRRFAEPGVKEQIHGEHIGMLSVLYRLRLFFDDRVTMVVKQTEDASVRIELCIPLDRVSDSRTVM